MLHCYFSVRFMLVNGYVQLYFWCRRSLRDVFHILKSHEPHVQSGTEIRSPRVKKIIDSKI